MLFRSGDLHRELRVKIQKDGVEGAGRVPAQFQPGRGLGSRAPQVGLPPHAAASVGHVLRDVKVVLPGQEEGISVFRGVGPAAQDARRSSFRQCQRDAADRARITPETELDVPATSVYQAGAIKLEEELSPAEAFETGMGEAAYTYLADHATKRIVIDVPAYGRATEIGRAHV